MTEVCTGKGVTEGRGVREGFDMTVISGVLTVSVVFIEGVPSVEVIDGVITKTGVLEDSVKGLSLIEGVTPGVMDFILTGLSVWLKAGDNTNKRIKTIKYFIENIYFSSRNLFIE